MAGATGLDIRSLELEYGYSKEFAAGLGVGLLLLICKTLYPGCLAVHISCVCR